MMFEIRAPSTSLPLRRQFIEILFSAMKELTSLQEDIPHVPVQPDKMAAFIWPLHLVCPPVRQSYVVPP